MSFPLKNICHPTMIHFTLTTSCDFACMLILIMFCSRQPQARSHLEPNNELFLGTPPVLEPRGPHGPRRNRDDYNPKSAAAWYYMYMHVHILYTNISITIVNIYIYTYTNTYMYIYTYTYTHMHVYVRLIHIYIYIICTYV